MMITSVLPVSATDVINVIHIDDNTATTYLEASQVLMHQEADRSLDSSSAAIASTTRQLPVWMDIAKLLDRLSLDYKRSKATGGNVTISEEVLEQLVKHWGQLLQHEEARLRSKVGDAVRVFYPVFSTATSTASLDQLSIMILQGIQDNWLREQTLRPTALGSVHMVEMDDTTGWRCLESYLHAFHNLLMGASRHLPTVGKLFPSLFNLQLGDNFLSAKDCVLFSLLHHTNRHIREKMYAFLFDLLNEATWQFLDVFMQLNIIDDVLDLIPVGLEDDWSQVRYSASKALDAVWTSIPSFVSANLSIVDMLSKHGEALVPRLCMNRFHPAKSLQTLSLDVWKRHLGPNALGRQQLALHSHAVLEYYITMAKSRNHMISEAALQAIAEFASKLDSSLIESHYEVLFATIAECLQDERWPVKDAACLCSGILWHYCQQDFSNLFQSFTTLYSTLLQDCMWSVRQNAAIAIGECCQSSFSGVGVTAANLGKSYVSNHILAAMDDEIIQQDQPVIVPESASVAASNAGRGVISSFLPKAMVDQAEAKKHQKTINTEVKESNNHAQHSPASNIPAVNMKKGWGCCIDCVDQRQTQKWEISQGAIYVLRELCTNYQQAFPLSTSTFTSSRNESGSSLDMIILLLQDTNYKSFDKLHACIYDEIPAVIPPLIIVASNETDKQKIVTFIKSLAKLIERDSALESDQPRESRPQARSSGTSSRVGRGGRSINESRKLSALKCKDILLQGNYPLINEHLLTSV